MKKIVDDSYVSGICRDISIAIDPIGGSEQLDSIRRYIDAKLVLIQRELHGCPKGIDPDKIHEQIKEYKRLAGIR